MLGLSKILSEELIHNHIGETQTQRAAVAVGTWYSGCDKSREGQGNFIEKETLEKVA